MLDWGKIMKFVELLKIIGAALGGITGICATIVAIFKPLRKGFVNWVVCNTGSANMAKQISEIEKMMKDHIGQDAQKAEDMKSLKDTVEKLKDSERCVLRTNILRIYNKYLPDGEIPAYEFETLSKDYHSYKSLEGNTFVDDIWEIMSKEWRVIPNGNYR